MVVVCGIKIADYCNQNNLTIKERLDLFINAPMLPLRSAQGSRRLLDSRPTIGDGCEARRLDGPPRIR